MVCMKTYHVIHKFQMYEMITLSVTLFLQEVIIFPMPHAREKQI